MFQVEPGLDLRVEVEGFLAEVVSGFEEFERDLLFFFGENFDAFFVGGFFGEESFLEFFEKF